MGNFEQMGIGIMLSARDMMSGPMGLIRGNFLGLQSAITSGAGRIMKSFAAIAAGAALLGTGLAGLRGSWQLATEAGEFTRTLTSVGIVSRATRGEMELLHQSAVQAGIATQFSPQEAAEGLQSLATAGQNAQASTQTLIPVLDLAAGSLGQLGVAEAASSVVGVLNSYQMSASEATGVTDRLLRVTQMTNFQASDFAVALGRLSSAGSLYNQTLDDQLIGMGLLRNANIEASVGSTSLREAQRRIYTEEQSLKNLREAGIDVYNQQTGAARDYLSIITDAYAATRSMTDEERNRFVVQTFGQRGMAAMNAIGRAQVEVTREGRRVTLTGIEAIRHMRTEMENADGTAQTFRETLADTFAGQMTLLTGTLQTLKITLGEVFGRIFKPLVLGVTTAINKFIQVWTAIPKGLQTFIGIAFLGTSAFMVLAGAILITAGIIGLLAPILSTVGVLILKIAGAIALALAPFIVLGAGAVAISIMIYKAYQKNLGGIADFIDNMIAKVRLTWDGLVQLFTQGGFSGAVLEEMEKAENEGIMQFVIKIFRFGSRLKSIWDGMVASIGPAFKTLGPAFSELGTALKGLFVEVAKLFGPTGKLVTGANEVPLSEYAAIGVTIARVIIGAIHGAIFATTMLIRTFKVLAMFMQPIVWVSKHAFGLLVEMIGVAGEYMDYLIPKIQKAVEFLYKLIEPLMPLLEATQAINRTVFATAGGVIGEIFRTGEDDSSRPEERGVRLSTQRRAESAERTESGRTPAAASAESTVASQRELQASIQQLAQQQQRGQQRPLEITIRNELDGEQIAESVTRVQERNGGLAGQVTRQT